MEKKPPVDPKLVMAFVGNAHGDFEKVKELLSQEPGLLNAACDWGGGDWETALGAAAHMGRKEIVRFLLEKGARPDIFTAAMLGEAEVVKAMLAAHPELKNAAGPHGISLLAHAKAGGEEANVVVKFLEA